MEQEHSDEAIRTEGISKHYEQVKAVKGINIEVKKGELFGLLGPNGAGKSTLIGMLATMLRPTEGTARVWGYDIRSEPTEVRMSIGVVFQGTTLDQKLTGRENLDIHGRLYGLGKKERHERIDEVLKLVELTDWADEVVQKYSGGMMRRLEIARGLMHHPNVLFLDEPTLGLDPQTRNHIWEYIKKLNQEKNITMILTTHYMEEADMLCNRIAIIDHGEIIAEGTPAELKAELGGDIITLTFISEDEAAKMVEHYKNHKIQTNHNADTTEITTTGTSIRITATDGERTIPELMKISTELNLHIESVSLRKPTLDDVFLHHTGKNIRYSGPDDRKRRRGIRRMSRNAR
ncbi:ATP-binding cassette domain-containing protein [Methanolobus sediminis]|uniref:ATP-binding cassette domain-containing protein n=1 Tax=Methanolobus sediminis TaxID=3072978 RepID=A0AA51UIX4_9EURY|nr:ATP-binding cassette domain-containing protein [Methanolobus sediminis]WMW24339.1 ATP-binding cassette domain-containing protein [Methanolobus sediminis]